MELFFDLGVVVVGFYWNNNLFVFKSSDLILMGDLVYVVVKCDQVCRMLSIFGYEEFEVGKVVIVGGGNIGFYVVWVLEQCQIGIKIKMIEVIWGRVMFVVDEFKCIVILYGSVFDQIILNEVDVGNVDILVVLINEDEVNILCFVMVKKFGCKWFLLLLNNLSYLVFVNVFGIDVFINLRVVMILWILQYVCCGCIWGVYMLQNGVVEVVEVEVLDILLLVGWLFWMIDLLLGIWIGVVFRGGDVLMLNGDLQIQVQDWIVIFVVVSWVCQVEQMFCVSFDFF